MVEVIVHVLHVCVPCFFLWIFFKWTFCTTKTILIERAKKNNVVNKFLSILLTIRTPIVVLTSILCIGFCLQNRKTFLNQPLFPLSQHFPTIYYWISKHTCHKKIYLPISFVFAQWITGSIYNIVNPIKGLSSAIFITKSNNLTANANNGKLTNILIGKRSCDGL